MVTKGCSPHNFPPQGKRGEIDGQKLGADTQKEKRAERPRVKRKKMRSTKICGWRPRSGGVQKSEKIHKGEVDRKEERKTQKIRENA